MLIQLIGDPVLALTVPKRRVRVSKGGGEQDGGKMKEAWGSWLFLTSGPTTFLPNLALPSQTSRGTERKGLNPKK